ncbi:MAG: glycosyltransferase [Lachnospiraceae bacterium]|nr:glycosyltransferase [Lachnospiraceae bacterium]
MNFGAVIVTYNRIQHLEKSIRCYTDQTSKPSLIVVVDNCSTDGTADFLSSWKAEEEGVEKYVITLPSNQGGSGGFYAGLEYIQKREDIDWIWVADDDAYPELNAFENAKKFIDDHQDLVPETAAICGVCGYDGHISPIQRSFLRKTLFGIQEFPIRESFYDGKEFFEINLYSFVGTIMKRENLLKAGLPNKDFFIYQDDLEHAVRLGKSGKLYCVTNIRIEHKDNVAPANEISWRDYYASRNLTYMYKEHFGKWSLFWRIVRRRVFAFLTFNFSKCHLVNIGIKDGKAGNLGVHPVYKPGWKV